MYLLGLHAIEESIKAGRKGSLYTVGTLKNKRALRIVELAKRQRVSHQVLSLKDFESLVGKEHRKIAFQTSSSEMATKVTLQSLLTSHKPSIVAILDGISDPHNLGAIMRSADQFGVSAIICPKDNSAKITATTSQSAAGADAYMPVFFESNMARVIDQLQANGYWVYAADMGGTALEHAKFPHKVAIIMGAEGRGVGRLLKEKADESVAITTMGHVDSLNVSVAAGIMFYEIRKQLQE